MDEQALQPATTQADILGTKSWLAYAGLAVLAALLLFGLLPLAFLWHDLAALAVLVLSALYLVYRFLEMRSVILYCDDLGVWVTHGVLPWQRVVSGVKWRDMDEATYSPGFLSWVTGSYRLRIGHRFTKSSEIVLTHMARGREAVATINARHQDLIRSGQID
jgi:hypothetical protein